jgi:hypothetical protein
MPVDHVMAKVRDGAIPSKTEAGFLFVDIMPEPTARVAQKSDEPAPSTFMEVSEAELEALADSLVVDPELFTPIAPAIATPFLIEATIRYSEDDEEGGDVVEPFEDEETPTFSAKDWRRVRAETGRLRKPPKAPLATAAA